jgi:hypothetical protein
MIFAVRGLRGRGRVGCAVSWWRLLPVMYTGIVRLRSFALALALLVAATPVIGIVCAMDCGQPPARSSTCHDGSVPHAGITLRGTPHACDHDHGGAKPALLTSSSARDSAGTSVAALAHAFVLAILPEAPASAAGAMHGPPGLTARSTSFQTTVLRI